MSFVSEGCLLVERKGVGLWGAIAIGIGGMVGGGIFAVLGVVATQAGGGAPLAFLVAGAIALLTASSYATLSVAYPSRGGSVVFVDRVFGVSVATGALNNLLWFGYLITLALYAVAFGNYAATFLTPTGQTASPWLLHLLISLAILIPTGLNLLGAASTARAETVLVGVKLAMLVFVGAIGLTTVDTAQLALDTWPSLPIIVAAGMLIFVAYEGFELIANSADDIREPRRNLPRALYVSVGTVIILYVAIAIVTVGSLTPKQIAASADFALAQAAQPSLGHVGFVVTALAAVLATLSAINATLYGTARLSYSIAREGELPDLFERRIWSEPVGLLTTAALSLAFANLLDVASISSIASAVFLIVFGTVNAAALRGGKEAGTNRALAGAGLVGCAGALAVLSIDTARNRPEALALLVGMAGLSLLGEALWLRRRRELRLGTGPENSR